LKKIGVYGDDGIVRKWDQQYPSVIYGLWLNAS
jgi:hypothetical protein